MTGLEEINEIGFDSVEELEHVVDELKMNEKYGYVNILNWSDGEHENKIEVLSINDKYPISTYVDSNTTKTSTSSNNRSSTLSGKLNSTGLDDVQNKTNIKELVLGEDFLNQKAK